MKNKILEIALKVLIVFYITLLGIFALTSCSASHSMEGFGKTTILQIVSHFYSGKFWYFYFLPFSRKIIFPTLSQIRPNPLPTGAI